MNYQTLTPAPCGIKPYYQDDAVTIYHGDCRQIVPLLGKFDLLLTDPPYGINADKKGAHSSIRDKKSTPDLGWDTGVIEDDFMNSIIRCAARSIIWGGNYYKVAPSPAWLVWVKPQAESGFSLADCEMAWTNMKSAARVKTLPRRDGNLHPTQKPLELMTWCIAQAGAGVKTILDPFAGSGTTGRAAKDMGRKAVLIEREERYCEIAAKRMLQEVLPL